MEREACVCDHGFERSDLCAEIIIIIIIVCLPLKYYIGLHLRFNTFMEHFWAHKPSIPRANNITRNYHVSCA